MASSEAIQAIAQTLQGLAGVGQSAISAYNTNIAGKNRAEVLRFADQRAREILAEKQARAELGASGIAPESPEGQAYIAAQKAPTEALGGAGGQTRISTPDLVMQTLASAPAPLAPSKLVGQTRDQTNSFVSGLSPEISARLSESLNRKQIDTSDLDRQERALAEKMSIYQKYGDYLTKDDFAPVASDLERIRANRGQILEQNRAIMSSGDASARELAGMKQRETLARFEADNAAKLQSENLKAQSDRLKTQLAAEAAERKADRALRKELEGKQWNLKTLEMSFDRAKLLNDRAKALEAEALAVDKLQQGITLLGVKKGGRVPKEQLLQLTGVSPILAEGWFFDKQDISLEDLKKLSSDKRDSASADRSVANELLKAAQLASEGASKPSGGPVIDKRKGLPPGAGMGGDVTKVTQSSGSSQQFSWQKKPE